MFRDCFAWVEVSIKSYSGLALGLEAYKGQNTEREWKSIRNARKMRGLW